jgi:hypothetical protein
MLTTGCGDGINAAHHALLSVTAPSGAADSGIAEPEMGWHGGEILTTDGTSVVPVFVYRPDDTHPVGWLGDNKTVVVRYFTQHGVASTETVCGLLADWIVTNGGAEPGQSCDTQAAAAHTGTWSDQLPTTDLQVGGENVEMSATVVGNENGIDVVYWAVAEA